MALNTYNSIVDAIPNWMHRQGDQIVQAVAPDLVTLAESEIYIKLRTRYQEQRFEAIIDGGTIPVPSDYTDLKYAYLDGTPVRNLTRKSPDWILSQHPYRSANGTPQFIARDIDVFIFGPYPDSSRIVKGVYYRQFDALAVTQTNELLKRYPKAFLFGALMKAEMFIRNDPSIDQMMPVWKGEFAQAMQEAQSEADRESMSGGRARIGIVGATP